MFLTIWFIVFLTFRIWLPDRRPFRPTSSRTKTTWPQLRRLRRTPRSRRARPTQSCTSWTSASRTWASASSQRPSPSDRPRTEPLISSRGQTLWQPQPPISSPTFWVCLPSYHYSILKYVLRHFNYVKTFLVKFYDMCYWVVE